MDTPARKFNDRSVVELGTLTLEEIGNLEAWCAYAKRFDSPRWVAYRKQVKNDAPKRAAIWAERKKQEAEMAALLAQSQPASGSQSDADKWLETPYVPYTGKNIHEMTDAEFEAFLAEDDSPSLSMMG